MLKMTRGFGFLSYQSQKKMWKTLRILCSVIATVRESAEELLYYMGHAKKFLFTFYI